MKSFSDFLGKRDRDNKEHLGILGKILEKAGFQVATFLDDRKEPHVFVHKPDAIDSILESLSFEGVRIYARGKDIICYRPQNKESTEPFGNAYMLDVKGMFKDILKETHKKDKIGHEIAKYVIEEIKNFFLQSAKAEKDQTPNDQDSQYGAAVVGGTGTDYANMAGDARNSRSGG